MSEHTETIPAQQRDDYKVGPGCPPREHQFQPGQSGNPAGSPKPKTNLQKHVARYFAMTDQEIDELDLEKLTQSEKTALNTVKEMASGKFIGLGQMIHKFIDRDEGKVADRHIVDTGNSPWEVYREWRDTLAEAGRKSIEAKVQRSESDVA